MKHLFLSLVFITLFTSCKETQKTESGPTKMEQVMSVHDEVMPKMGAIARLVGALNEDIEVNGASPEKEKADHY